MSPIMSRTRTKTPFPRMGTGRRRLDKCVAVNCILLSNKDLR